MHEEAEINQENEWAKARESMLEMSEQSKGAVGEITWKREDLYDRECMSLLQDEESAEDLINTDKIES